MLVNVTLQREVLVVSVAPEWSLLGVGSNVPLEMLHVSVHASPGEDSGQTDAFVQVASTDEDPGISGKKYSDPCMAVHYAVGS